MPFSGADLGVGLGGMATKPPTPYFVAQIFPADATQCRQNFIRPLAKILDPHLLLLYPSITFMHTSIHYIHPPFSYIFSFLCVKFWYNPYEIRDTVGSDSVFAIYMKMGRESYPKFWLDARDIGKQTIYMFNCFSFGCRKCVRATLDVIFLRLSSLVVKYFTFIYFTFFANVLLPAVSSP